MKMFGAVLVVIAMGLGGMIFANALQDRVKELQQFVRGLHLLAAEIGYGLNPLEVAFRRVAKTLNNRVGEFFTGLAEGLHRTGNVSQAWRDAVLSSKPQLVLTLQDWETLEEFADSWGNTDKEHQGKSVQQMIIRLEERLEEARGKMAAGDRLYRFAGFAIGIVLVLLLY